MISYIRKNAVPLAVLSVLLGAFAAPYLLPINPDSGVFRYGVYAALIVAGCYLPVKTALRRATGRELICGMAFGLLFSLSLSLGSELHVYDGLLPGMGSLLRRAAIPVMATPMIGGLAARFFTAKAPFAQRSRSRIPFWGYAAIIFLCWVPVLLTYFPAMLNYDFISEYTQHLTGQYSNLNPLLSSLILNAVITLGETLHSRTFGLLLMSLLQMVCLSLSLGYGCAFARRRGAPRWALALMLVFFGLHPVFSAMSVSMTKDTLFAAAVVMLSLKAWEFLEHPDEFFFRKSQLILLVVFAALTALLRNNGVFALVLLLPGMIVGAKGHRKQAAALCAVCAAASLALFGVLQIGLHPESMPSFQFYSIPAQQLVRAYNSGHMPEADKAELESYYLSPDGLLVHPHLADFAKGYLDSAMLAEKGDAFMHLWARNLRPCAMEYAEAFLMLNVGSWYPDDLSHSTIYPDASWSDKGYLQTQEYDLPEMGFETVCLLPDFEVVFEQICRQNRYQKYAILPIFFCTAMPFWGMILACFALAARRRARYAPAAFAALGLWASYLLGPCTLPRYALPLFCLAPVFLASSKGRVGVQPAPLPEYQPLPCRFANSIAVCAVLGLLVAAPYCNPIDPDSALFHSAVLPVLLACGCFEAIRLSLLHRSRSELTGGIALGLIFAICLSLGCELTTYGKLLPGMGSLVRRVAVPLLATPAIGLMLAHIFAFALAPRRALLADRFRIPSWAFFLLFAACYGAVLLAFFPGVISYDFEHEIRQFTTGVYEAAHPVAHTLFLGALYQLGETLFGTMNAGAATYSAVQLLLLAAMYAWVCSFVQRRAPLPVVLALVALFALMPLHSVLAISTAKDPLFTGLCVMLCCFLWEAAEDPLAFSVRHAIRFTLCCLGMALLRHNAVFAFLPACLGLVALLRRRAAMATVALSLVLCLIVPKGFEIAMHAEKTPSSELMSIPCQQLMRTAEMAPITEAEKAELNAWFSDATFRYRPHCADPAKGGNFDFARFQAHPEEYWEIYFRYAGRFPVVYLEAFLENCAGLWNPNDISHATAMTGEEYDFTYLNTTYSYEEGRYDLHPHSLLPKLRTLIYNSTHHAKHQNIMFIAELFCPGVYTFLMLLSCMALARRKARGQIWAFAPLWGIWLSLLFSAGIFIRYAYPIMSGATVLLLLALFSRKPYHQGALDSLTDLTDKI